MATELTCTTWVKYYSNSLSSLSTMAALLALWWRHFRRQLLVTSHSATMNASSLVPTSVTVRSHFFTATFMYLWSLTNLFSPSCHDPSPSPTLCHTGAMNNLGSDLGPATAQFVWSHGLEAFSGSLSIVVGHVPIPQWHAKVHSLDLMQDLTASLMNAMTCDWKDSGSA